MTATEAVKPLRADARRNRERILSAAVAVFAESGPEAQIDDVAARAGVGVGTIYRHFPTKEALMAELVRQKFRRFAANARIALDSEQGPFEAFAGLLRANAELCAADVTMQHALSGFASSVWAQAQDEAAELNGLVGELVARAQRDGSLRQDVSANDIPMLMCGVSTTMARSGPGFDWRRHLELLISMMRA